MSEIDAPPLLEFGVLTDFDHYTDFMPHTKETRVIARQGEDRRTVYQRLKPPIVEERDYAIEITLSQEDGGVCQSRRTSAPDAVPLAEGCVRVRINSGTWRVEPLPGDRARLIHRLQTHPGGSIPTWVANRSDTVATPALFTAIRREVARRVRG